jgi:hypothetical protein
MDRSCSRRKAVLCEDLAAIKTKKFKYMLKH